MEKNILVVGGAGYIGSHMCKYLHQNGYTPIVLDNLVYGHHQAVKWGPFIRGDASDRALLHRIFSENRITGVMHFAAFTYVGESVTDPAKYYDNNVGAALRLLQAMVAHQVKYLIFSSTCAVYGKPVESLMTEAHSRQPVNPYGRTKYMVEQILKDFDAAYGLKSVCLRYFNAAGADPEGELGEDHNPETHLIPLILEVALGKRDKIQIYGNDYPTPDGTCIRDYIHINDLAQAHLLAFEKLLNGGESDEYNLGNGGGYSVQAVIDACEKITGRPIPSEVTGRRAGDPPMLIGSSEKAIRELGWQPEYPDLEKIIETAWQWHRRHPNGFEG